MVLNQDKIKKSAVTVTEMFVKHVHTIRSWKSQWYHRSLKINSNQQRSLNTKGMLWKRYKLVELPK